MFDSSNQHLARIRIKINKQKSFFLFIFDKNCARGKESVSKNKQKREKTAAHKSLSGKANNNNKTEQQKIWMRRMKKSERLIGSDTFCSFEQSNKLNRLTDT